MVGPILDGSLKSVLRKLSSDDEPLLVEVRRFRNKWEIDFCHKESAPKLTFDFLVILGKFFGTDRIDVDNHSISDLGCDTCDYGMRNGHTIQIYEPTKNVYLLNLADGGDFDV